MKFREVKTDYLNHIRFEAMLAKTTFQSYQAGLNRYGNWLADQGYGDAEIDVALTTQVLRKYQYYLAGLKLRPRTMHGAFDPLQAVCKYLIKMDALDNDPCAKLTLPKRDEAQRLRMSDEEVRNLLEAAERQVSSRDAAQSKAVIAVFCFTGVRADECASIQVSSIRFDFERPMFSVVGKGSKPRNVYMPDDCVGPLKAWLAERAKMNCVHDYLWASSSKRYVSDEWLRKDIEKVKAIAGYKGRANIKPHSMRHWYATNLMRRGASVKQIQVALGHTSAKTTIIYLGIDEDDQQAVGAIAGLRPDPAGPAASAKAWAEPDALPRPAAAPGPRRSKYGKPMGRLVPGRGSRQGFSKVSTR